MKLRSFIVCLAIGVSLLCSLALPSYASNLPVEPSLEVKNVAVADQVNLNQASQKELLHSFKAIKGIGKQRVQAVIDYRDQHQGFKSVQELSKVKGFSAKFVKTNLQLLEEIFTVK